MQNKQAYTLEVCRRITWAIIVNTRLFFDDIKLAEDFFEHENYMQFPASTLEGDFMSIKHSIKIQRHNFPVEWGTSEPQYTPPSPLLPWQDRRRGLPTFGTAINTSSWHVSTTTAKKTTSLRGVLQRPLSLSSTYVEMYHTSTILFGSKQITIVAALNVIPYAPWWSAALAHTITWCMPTPIPSMQVSFPHHG